MKNTFLIPLLFMLVGLNAQEVQIGNTTLTHRDVVTDLQIPWEILWGPDDHIWVTERRGRVLRVEPTSGNTNIILNIESVVFGGEDGEPGMLGMALHPDFPASSYVYLVYTYGNQFNIRERLVRYEWDGSQLTNEEIFLNELPGFRIHDGSRLLITQDRKLLMTTGDRGNVDTSQDTSSLNGKILRFNLDGTIPNDNPFPGSYIYSYGHRNPQGLCQGPDGTIYSSEHGPQNSDEINIIQAGRNYGWPFVEGACNLPDEEVFCNMNNVVEPIAEWSPCIAVNGLVYYNHPAIPEFENSLLMAVLGGASITPQPRISHLPLNADGDSILAEYRYFENFGRLRDLCINPHNGAIYFATNGPEYPGMGPNRIIEYRNLEYQPDHTPDTAIPNQFIRVFPNPMTKNGTIEFSKRFLGHNYEIFSFSGQKMMAGKIDQPLLSLPATEWSTGTYFVRAGNEAGTITKTFVIQ